MKKNITFILLLLIITGFQINAQDLSKYEKKTYLRGKDTISYRVLYPEKFSAQQKYPVLIFLHGSGERGTDNEKQLVHGGKLFLDPAIRKDFPAIVIFPQCSTESYWSNVEKAPKGGNDRFKFQKRGKPTTAMHALLALVDEVVDEPYVDDKKVYVAGLSMGAMGTYELLRRKPKTFAAAFAICGGDHVANVRKYKNVPLWIFHGGKDDVVSPELSKTIADQLKIIGREVKYTLYADDAHNSWDSAFAEPQLLPWLFSHQK